MMDLTDLRIELFAPGMTPMHRAGLGGLVASLRAFERDSEHVDGLAWDITSSAVTLSFEMNDAAALVRLVEESMTVEDGLIVFRAFRDLPAYTLEAKAHHNECLLGTLLQHNKMLKPDGARKEPRSIEIDGKNVSFSVKKLADFAHRFSASELRRKKDGGLERGPLEVKGWALPGAVKRHEKAADTALKEPPDRFLCLLFAIVGIVPFRLSTSRDSEKFKYAVVIPEVDNLDDFARARRRLIGGARSLTASCAGDAALHFFRALHAAAVAERLCVPSCQAIAMGTVAWSKNQKTRTERLEVVRPSDEVLRALECIVRHFPVEIATKKDGGGFSTVAAWRRLATANLACGRPWWMGFGEELHDKERRKELLEYEGRKLKEMVKEMMKEGLIGTDRQQKFVEACHGAIRQRYGELYDRISREGLDRRAIFSRENENMRVAFTRCKNASTFRSAVVDLWARGGRNETLKEHWKTMLEFFGEESWQLGRDLALLALASYSGAREDEADESDASSDEVAA